MLERESRCLLVGKRLGREAVWSLAAKCAEKGVSQGEPKGWGRLGGCEHCCCSLPACKSRSWSLFHPTWPVNYSKTGFTPHCLDSAWTWSCCLASDSVRVGGFLVPAHLALWKELRPSISWVISVHNVWGWRGRQLLCPLPLRDWGYGPDLSLLSVLLLRNEFLLDD